MIVDSSALTAIVLDEPQTAACLGALLESPANRMSAATFLEAAIVADRLPDPNDRARFDRLIDRLDIVVEPLTARQATIAREAYGRFGKGIGHPARLTSATALPTRRPWISTSRFFSSGEISSTPT